LSWVSLFGDNKFRDNENFSLFYLEIDYLHKHIKNAFSRVKAT
jgi:hypothetical protein